MNAARRVLGAHLASVVESEGGTAIDNDRSTRDDRLLDLARRVLSGEAIDWEQEGIAESEVREGMKRLQRLLENQGDATETAAATPLESRKSHEGQFIGDFRLVRKLGEGGMGVVYEAEQQHPRRPVALKVIRGGAHVSEDTLKLFQRESSTLARLRHPGIAALYETGATDDGLHYFAMELVRGSTLLAWLGSRPAGRMTPDELRLRLSVFKKICDAVAYAHQKGVIHRDLKPANVLIPKTSATSSIQDVVPDIKVLDFGLARITDSDVQATTYVTEMGRVQGTLPYMSPEQVRGNPDEIDLRTDVYSLGVMLYEMVTGRMPYDLSKAQIPEAVRIICEESPKSISATFTGTRRLDADVITIAGKCLEKEASRRYQSAAQLGEDIQRYLSDQPILARPPSAAYQFRKLAARHKGAFAFAGTVFVLVTALAVTSTFQAIRIAKERDRANQEAETAKQVSEFLEGLFKVSDPSEARGNSITARELLDRGAEEIDHELQGQDVVQARLMDVMGRVYMGLGLLDRARPLIEGTIDARARLGEENSLEVADALNALGEIERQSGRLVESSRLAERAHAIRASVLPKDDPRLAAGLWYLGSNQMVMEKFDEANATFLQGLELVDEAPAEFSRVRVWLLNDLANSDEFQGRLESAEARFRRALDVATRTLPEGDPDIAQIRNNICFLLTQAGRYDEGRPYCERAIADDVRVLGPDHPTTINHYHSLGELERRAGRLDRAEQILTAALAAATGPDRAMIELSLAQTLEAAGRLAEAEAGYRRVLAMRLGDDLQGVSRGAAEVMELLAGLLRKTGRAADAGPLEARARDVRSRMGTGAAIGSYSTSAPTSHRK